MNIANVVVIIIGIFLIICAFNKTLLKGARKIGGWLLPFATGGYAFSQMMNEQEKDLATKTWLIWVGGLLVACAIFAAFL